MSTEAPQRLPEDLSVLQRMVFPHTLHPDRAPLYVRRGEGGVTCPIIDGAIQLSSSAEVDFSTYYNAVSFSKWRAVADLNSLTLRIRGTGVVTISLFVFDAHCKRSLEAEVQGELSEEGLIINAPRISGLEGLIISASIRAGPAGARVASGEWLTSDPPVRVVKLAMVITTFNREAAVQEAADKFIRLLSNEPSARDAHLFIVDNGRNLTLPDDSHVTLIRNRNLGGAGGFTRGLLKVIDTSAFTHCLFMDDDASCDPESVLRVIALLARVRNERAAVAGAMLLVERPCVQAEKGAIIATDTSLPWYFVAQNSQIDIASLEGVVQSDGTDAANYGGWWFFAFPLAAARILPFPFFVRGDDVDFSLVNKLPIITMNGVATWCEAFAIKLVAPVEFLACRAWFALLLKHADTAATRLNLRRVLSYAFSFGVRYDYATMEAAVSGLEFALRGPEAFGADPAPLQRLREIRDGSSEVPVTDAVAASSRTYERPRSASRLLFIMTLAGHLLPSERDPRPLRAEHGYDFAPDALIRTRWLIWRSGGRLVCMQRDRFRMAMVTLRWLRLFFLSKRRLRQLGRDWRDRSLRYQCRDYWEDQF